MRTKFGLFFGHARIGFVLSGGHEVDDPQIVLRADQGEVMRDDFGGAGFRFRIGVGSSKRTYFNARPSDPSGRSSENIRCPNVRVISVTVAPSTIPAS